MLDKVNVTRILVDHLSTLKHHSTKRYRPADFILFFGVPGIVTGVLVYFYGNLQPTVVSIVATSLTIFAALLFNLLLMVYDAMGKSDDSNRDSFELRQSFLKEVFSNISFAILVALVSIIMVLTFVLVACSNLAERILSGVIYFLVTLFLLTLLMLLKRVHILIFHEATRK